MGSAGVAIAVTVPVCPALDGVSLEDAFIDAVVPLGLQPYAELAVH